MNFNSSAGNKFILKGSISIEFIAGDETSEHQQNDCDVGISESRYGTGSNNSDIDMESSENTEVCICKYRVIIHSFDLDIV